MIDRGFANEDFGEFAALYHEQLQEQSEAEKWLNFFFDVYFD